jgi:hypothetical protein
MPPSPPPSASAVFLLVAALSACASSSKPPESPDTPASTAEAESSPRSPPSGEGAAAADIAAPPEEGAKPSNVDKSMSLDTYEMTPSDCDALGRQYGEVARKDQMAALNPKLSEKQRSATAAQVETVVGKIEEAWIGRCQTALVNKAVDHDAIKCALNAKTVKDFDVCLNGSAGTPQPTGKKKK